jgi:glycosyltransferase involved in cell wall biosynthesis
MIHKVIIILPAYNAEKTLEKTYQNIPEIYRNGVLLVDDCSKDHTVKLAKKLKIQYLVHKKNLGYGGNQKTCFNEILKYDYEIVILLHPDYQYPPQLVEPLVKMINTGFYDCVLGSRILCGGAIRGKMPIYKYISNRLLTVFENILTGAKLSEYHTGLRAYKCSVLRNLQYNNNSNDFIFDNQILMQLLAHSYKIGEISSPCQYFHEASSINLKRSIVYGFGCCYWGFMYFLGRFNIYKHPLLYN